jgi:hypothetical protein
LLRKAIYIILLFIPLLTLGQKLPSGFQKKWIAVAGRDSLRIDSVSIQPFGFKVFDSRLFRGFPKGNVDFKK